MNDIVYSSEKQRLKVFREGIAQFLTSDSDRSSVPQSILIPFVNSERGHLNEEQIIQTYCENLNILLGINDVQQLAALLVEMQQMLSDLSLELEFMGKINIPSVSNIYTRIGQGLVVGLIDLAELSSLEHEESQKKLKNIVCNAIEEELFFWN